MGSTMNPTNTSDAPDARSRRKGRVQLLLIVLGVIGSNCKIGRAHV